ncbi:MAG: ATP-binding protein [Pirellulales bacterium]|nr:ATP-binding protein [Pirellulales bacterium]
MPKLPSYARWPWGAELLFEVISTAYERQSVIVTTNLPFGQWTEVLGSERLTGAVLDRLTHRCHILEATGESYRLQSARRPQAEDAVTTASAESSPPDSPSYSSRPYSSSGGGVGSRLGFTVTLK